jgi:predicted NBD/HSP70 family sugar kinase
MGRLSRQIQTWGKVDDIFASAMEVQILTTRKGSNSVQVRRYNERVVLEALQRLGMASKADLARATQLTAQAIADIVDALADAGLVEHRGRRTGQIGQPSVLYAPAPDGAYAIGLHIGRRALDAVLVDFAGTVRRFESSEYDYPDPDSVGKLAASYVNLLTGSLPSRQRERIVGIGVAIPYFLGGWANELGFPLSVAKSWQSLDLRQHFLSEIGQPLRFENDASAAATAELVYGRGRQYKNWIYVSINTFIGGGLIINGNLEVGPHGNSAALAPHPVSPSRLSTVSAPARPFEVLLHRASVYVLMNHLRTHGVAINRANDLETLGLSAEPFLTEWIEDAADALAQVVIGSIAVIDIEAIVIDAILPRALLERIVFGVHQRFFDLVPDGLIAPEIVTGTIGRQAAAIGGAILPLYAMFAPDSGVLVKSAAEKKTSMIFSG